MLIYEVRTLDISSIVSVSSNFLVVCFFLQPTENHKRKKSDTLFYLQ